MKLGTSIKASASQQVQLKYALKSNGLEAENYFRDNTYLLATAPWKAMYTFPVEQITGKSMIMTCTSQ